MKRQDLFDLHKIFSDLSTQKQAIKFSYFIAKNINILKSEIDIFEKASTPCNEFIEYEKYRLELCQKFCEKDNEGKPFIQDNNYVFSDDNKSMFIYEIGVLREKYKNVIEKRESQEKEINSMLEDDVTIEELYKVRLNDIVDDIEPYILQKLLELDLIIEES